MRSTRYFIRGVRLTSLVVAFLLLASSGCGRRTGNVSGKVFYQGKPLPGGSVMFMSEAPGAAPKTSEIQPDGSYRIAGIPVGPAAVTVRGKRYPRLVLLPGQEKAGVFEGKYKEVYVPPQYGSTEQSGLTLDVQGGYQQYDIQLK